MGFTFLILMLTIVSAIAYPINNQIHLLMPHSGSPMHKDSELNCLSWRLAIETNNIQDWIDIPESCRDYVSDYMLGTQYSEDCDLVAVEAYEYAKGLNLAGDGKDIWVLDVDETILSNLPFFVGDDFAFGAKPYNLTLFNEWLEKGAAPAIPEALQLYNQVIQLGFKIVFITGMEETYREIRIKNLKAVGYNQWEKLILKGDNYHGTTVEYKSSKRKELEEGGYRIRGNVGDQWSDLIGTNPGDRTFKMPNPMYNVP